MPSSSFLSPTAANSYSIASRVNTFNYSLATISSSAFTGAVLPSLFVLVSVSLATLPVPVYLRVLF